MKHVIAAVIGLALVSGCSATFSLGDSSARSNARPAETPTTETASTDAKPTEETSAPAPTEESKTEQPTEQAGAGGLDPQ
jgi:hypothetical protein